jgi:hypothetical protein
MPFIEMLKPITDKVEELQTASVETAKLSNATYLYVVKQKKTQRRINIALALFPIVLLGFYHYFLC